MALKAETCRKVNSTSKKSGNVFYGRAGGFSGQGWCTWGEANLAVAGA